MKNYTTLSLLALLVLNSNANSCVGKIHDNNEGVPVAPEMMEETMKAKTIVDIAVADPNFSTLVKALKVADLVSTLSGSDKFTVFAPTNDAFAKIPKEDLDALLADKAKLTKVLTYHVVPGKVMSAEVVNIPDAKTVEGSKITFMTKDGKVYVNDAEVVKADVDAENGVIHVIDTVLLPK